MTRISGSPSAPAGEGAHASTAAHVLPFAEALDAIGIPYHAWLAKAGLPTEISDPLQLVESHRLVRFVHQVSYSEGIPELGMLAAQQGPGAILHPRTLRRLEAAPTLLTALRAARELVHLQGSTPRIWLDLRPRQLHLCHASMLPSTQPGAEHFEALRTIRLVTIIERYLGRGWRPSRIGLVMPRLRDPLFQEWLGVTEVQTGAPCGLIPIPIERLGDSVVTDHEGAGEAGPEESGTPSWTLRLSALEAAVASRLAHDVPTIDMAAEMAGVGKRTLQRRLADAGTSYREFLSHVRFREARRLLLDTDIAVREVASRVGYDDPSNFARAFRRVGGLGPSDVRAPSGAK